MKTLGIYIHIPFCVQKCAYCDFVSFPVGRDCKSSDSEKRGLMDSYFAALCEEIEKDREYGLLVDSVFFGGGTPSVVPEHYVEMVLCKLKEKYQFTDDCEISMEINPGTVDIISLAEYRKFGINRISIGAQSLCDSELQTLGRIHSAQDFRKAFQNAREAGFDNISIDLMSALPGQSAENFRASLEQVLELSPEHLSVYSLILEEGTPLFDMREKLCFPDEDTVEKIDRITWDMTKNAGYHRYEISNFSKEGRECRHNLRYWRREYYRGYGIAASSMLPAASTVLPAASTVLPTSSYMLPVEKKNDEQLLDVRFSSEITMEDYEEDHGKPFDQRTHATEYKHLSKEEAMEEFFFLGLRTTEGVDLNKFRSEFGENATVRFKEPMDRYIGLGLLVLSEDGHLKFTENGMQVSTVVLADFLL